MSLIRFTQVDPMREFEQLLPELWGNRVAGMAPSLDVYQTDHDVVIEAPLPGIDASKVQVSIENDVLSISGQHEQKTEVDDQRYYRREVRRGQFHRSVALPTAVDGQKAKAKYESGILTITVPIQERAKPTQVKVEVR